MKEHNFSIEESKFISLGDLQEIAQEKASIMSGKKDNITNANELSSSKVMSMI